MASTTTVTGPITTPGGDPSILEGTYVTFTLLSAGTDPVGEIVNADPVGVEIDANGDFSVDLWVNGESGIESVYSIKLPYHKGLYQVIIPSTSIGGSITLQELLDFHQTTDSNTQQSNVLDEAKAYTNTLASDPVGFGLVDEDNWQLKLNYYTQPEADAAFSPAGALFPSDIGVTVQAWAALLDVIDQDLSSTADVTFNDLGLSGGLSFGGSSFTSISETVVDSATTAITGSGIVAYAQERLSTTAVASTSYSVLASDKIILADDDTAAAAMAITLLSPASAGDGYSLTIKKLGTTADIEVLGDVDGDSSLFIQAQYESLSIVCDGATYHII